jgi:succinyl-diaminopimelate desuccinylase
MTTERLAAFAVAAREILVNRRSALIALCHDLVQARSVNPPGDTREVAGVVVSALESFGIHAEVEAKDESMPSVLARIDSGKPGRHLVHNVHLDTMPAGDESLWSVDPYTMTRKGGKLFGLGMGNMKGSVAAMVHASAILNEQRDWWSGSITFTAVSDEVVFGPHGAAHLIETHPELLADGLICGEGPGFRRLSIAEKGVLWLAIEATGEPGHSSSVRPMKSASAKLAAIVQRIDQMTGTRSALPEELEPLFPADDPGRELSANVGTIQAGSFIGQVATSGTIEVDFRVPPGMTIDHVEHTVTQMASDIPGLNVRRIKGWNPSWTAPDTDLCQAWHSAEAALSEQASSYAIRLPASDASRWRAHGVPALCFGPQPGLSAGIDDYAEEDEVIRAAELFAVASVEFLRRSKSLAD